MKNLISALMIVLLVVLTACSNIPTANSNMIKENTWYPLGKILDNQTFEIVLDDHIEQVTFLSLDVVNIHHEELGDGIYQFLSDQLTKSEEIRLSFDEQIRNERGQLQAIVHLKDDTNLNEALLSAGFAKVLISEPNIKMENVYKKIEQEAKSLKLGIWIDNNETSNQDVTLKDAPYTGIRLSVDKTMQKTLISNYTMQDLDLSRWKLVSVRGKEVYIFEDVILEPGESVAIYAKNSNQQTKEQHIYYWGLDQVWSLEESESAELYNTNNELIAEWTE